MVTFNITCRYFRQLDRHQGMDQSTGIALRRCR